MRGVVCLRLPRGLEVPSPPCLVTPAQHALDAQVMNSLFPPSLCMRLSNRIGEYDTYCRTY